MEHESETNFTFRYLSSKQFESVENKDLTECLMKWSMLNRIKIQAFSYDQSFKAYQKDEFLLAFFQDPLVNYSLQVLSTSGKWIPFGFKVNNVTIEDVSCSQTSMSFFDRLYNDEVVRGTSTSIVKCYEEYYEEMPDVSIDDELKKMLLVEGSDHYNMYNESERQEFLFLIFRHFVIGGSLCQHEDMIEPYLTMTKSLYKDLISIHKGSKSGELTVSTMVFKVTIKDEHGTIYPSSESHFQDFAYICINPMRKHVYVLYHKYGVSLPEVH